MRYLSYAFAETLRRQERKGARWVPSAKSPQSGATNEEPDAVKEIPDHSHEANGVLTQEVSDVDRLTQIRRHLGDCQRCALAGGRTHLVFGEGSSTADVMIVGEAPGRDEDLQGVPFVGAAGQLLTKMIKAMGLERDEVYICNILKCRPPDNRNPEPEEVEACEPFLLKQIDAIHPHFIVAMGNFAAKTLLRTSTGITRLRGQFHSYHGIPVMPTFHPA
ncbi:MAG: uracil-DNA glycosylase, partial [Deltaproteobacteria bacterium]|nr:uracil-DNA glycosylase [Deltaproteobacteria bacterium]